MELFGCGVRLGLIQWQGGGPLDKGTGLELCSIFDAQYVVRHTQQTNLFPNVPVEISQLPSFLGKVVA